jgi:hypothetical protein
MRNTGLLLVLLLTVVSAFGQSTLEERVASAKKAMLENPAPEGMSWEYAPETNAAFLKPDGWVVSKKTEGDVQVFAISVEDPAKDGQFTHGFTVFTIPMASSNEDPVEHVKKARDQMAATYKTISKHDFDMGPFKAFNLLCFMPEQKIGIFQLNLANPKTKTVYGITFEAPAADFDQYWQDYGHAMIDSFILDDEE